VIGVRWLSVRPGSGWGGLGRAVRAGVEADRIGRQLRDHVSGLFGAERIVPRLIAAFDPNP